MIRFSVVIGSFLVVVDQEDCRKYLLCNNVVHNYSCAAGSVVTASSKASATMCATQCLQEFFRFLSISALSHEARQPTMQAVSLPCIHAGAGLDRPFPLSKYEAGYPRRKYPRQWGQCVQISLKALEKHHSGGRIHGWKIVFTTNKITHNCNVCLGNVLPRQEPFLSSFQFLEALVCMRH